MDSPDAPSAAQELEQLLCRALKAAHLITGTLEWAEEAVLRGTDLWNPDQEPEEELLLKIMEAAVRLYAAPEPNESTVSDSYLGDELKAVLRLDPRLRACFVLRNLVGLPSQACARLLRLLPNEIDEDNVSALRGLALFRNGIGNGAGKQERPAQYSYPVRTV